MSLPEEEEPAAVPDWIEGRSVLLQQVFCPRWNICKWQAQFLDEQDEEVQIRKDFEDHWRDHHA